MKLMELNWQKSRYMKTVAADECTRSEVKVGTVQAGFALPKSWNATSNVVNVASVLQACHGMLRLTSTLNLWTCLQSKKQSLKEKIEADVGALVQFLLDERDSLLESLDAEEVAAMAVIEDNLKRVETQVKDVDKAIADINKHISGKTSFEVGPGLQPHAPLPVLATHVVVGCVILLGRKHFAKICWHQLDWKFPSGSILSSLIMFFLFSTEPVRGL